MSCSLIYCENAVGSPGDFKFNPPMILEFMYQPAARDGGVVVESCRKAVTQKLRNERPCGAETLVLRG